MPKFQLYCPIKWCWHPLRPPRTAHFSFFVDRRDVRFGLFLIDVFLEADWWLVEIYLRTVQFVRLNFYFGPILWTAFPWGNHSRSTRNLVVAHKFIVCPIDPPIQLFNPLPTLLCFWFPFRDILVPSLTHKFSFQVLSSLCSPCSSFIAAPIIICSNLRELFMLVIAYQLQFEVLMTDTWLCQSVLGFWLRHDSHLFFFHLLIFWVHLRETPDFVHIILY